MLIPQTWNRQPPLEGGQISRPDPDLMFLFSGNTRFRESVYGDIGTFGDTLSSFAVSSAGHCLDVGGSGLALSYGASWNRLGGATAATFEILFSPDSINSGKILGKWGGGVDAYLIELVGSGRVAFFIGSTLGRSGREASGFTLTAGKLYHIIYAWRAPNIWTLYINGVKQTLVDFASSSETSITSIGSDTSGSIHRLGVDNGGPTFDGKIYLCALRRRALTESEILFRTKNPWQLFAPRPRRIWTTTSSGISGTFSRTNNNDTLVSSGTTQILGTFTRTNNNDTLLSSGTTQIVGTFSRTALNDSLVATGSVGAAVDGSFSKTNNNDILAGIGTTTVSGSFTQTAFSDVLVAYGNITITGSFSRTNNNDVLSSSGIVGTAPDVSTRLTLTNVGK